MQKLISKWLARREVWGARASPRAISGVLPKPCSARRRTPHETRMLPGPLIPDDNAALAHLRASRSRPVIFLILFLNSFEDPRRHPCILPHDRFMDHRPLVVVLRFVSHRGYAEEGINLEEWPEFGTHLIPSLPRQQARVGNEGALHFVLTRPDRIEVENAGIV